MTALQELAEGAIEVKAAASAAAEVELTGMIASPVNVDGDRASFQLSVESILLQRDGQLHVLKERMMVQVKLLHEEEQRTAAAWRRGDRIQATGELQLPAGATNFGGFDYRRYLHTKRIHWLFKVQGAQVVNTQPGSSWTLPALLGIVDQPGHGWVNGWTGCTQASMQAL